MNIRNKDVQRRSKGCTTCHDITVFAIIGFTLLLAFGGLIVSLGNFTYFNPALFIDSVVFWILIGVGVFSHKLIPFGDEY